MILASVINAKSKSQRPARYPRKTPAQARASVIELYICPALIFGFEDLDEDTKGGARVDTQGHFKNRLAELYR